MLLVLAGVLWTVPAMGAGDGRRVFLDGFAARVGGTVILDSDVTIEIALRNALAGSEGREPPPVDRGAVLEALIERELLLGEARKFITRTLTGDEIAAAEARLDARYGGTDRRRSILESLHLDEAFWNLRVRNMLLIEKYIAQRVAQFIRVTRADEDAYIVAHAADLGLGDVENPAEAVPPDHPIRKIVNELLTRQAVDARRSELILELRESQRIEIIDKTAGDGMAPVRSETRQPHETQR